MHLTPTTLLKQAMKFFGVGITRYSTLQRLNEIAQLGGSDIDFLLELRIPEQSSEQLFSLLRNSKSQLRQDLFALSEVGFKRDGFFVEFGATNGIDLSNTYLLENAFGWSGILAEPARKWHQALKNNRSCNIETDCVWRESSSTLTFIEVDRGEFSTIKSFSGSDSGSARRKHGTTYNVKTISLEDLLCKFHAPSTIDYLSIDTEGSEYEILRNFDFDKYRFNVITCEHNFTQDREKVYALLTQHNYVRKFTRFSSFDDWYVRADCSQ
jgi:FkbM family methyltransferase